MCALEACLHRRPVGILRIFSVLLRCLNMGVKPTDTSRLIDIVRLTQVPLDDGPVSHASDCSVVFIFIDPNSLFNSIPCIIHTEKFISLYAQLIAYGHLPTPVGKG